MPDCLKMVLASFGLILSEVDLREQCDCTPFGTDALQAVDAVRKLGFVNTVKGTSSIEELLYQLSLDRYPIVFINLLPIDEIKSAHAIVLTDLDSDWVKICDPLQGDRVLPRSTFDVAWRMMRNLVISIQ